MRHPTDDEIVTFCNLAKLDTALRGGLLDLIEVQLLAVGGGPTLDFESATAFLATFETTTFFWHNSDPSADRCINSTTEVRS
jgi:hypothetical protein